MKFKIGEDFCICLIRVYQKKISPLLNKKGVKCRFYPTCSDYMIMAITKYGMIRGIIKGISRIKRCRPDN
ncbi:MAG: membrane protein insertion efficiency factor YidD, partial [Methanomicrobium sp.]|nr:membrane protein insertion efficiency factor YidD [Methanomicrobium sp.]